jgi:UPF0755 protein
MKIRLRRTLPTALFILGLFLFSGICLAFGGLYYLFSRVESIYGPPKAGITLTERIYLSARLYAQVADLTVSGTSEGTPRDFEIVLGETPTTIASNLQATGLIPDADAFVTYLRYAGLDTTLQAGSYQLSPGQTAVEIAISLQDATPKDITFSILPGWRLEEIAAGLPTSGLEFNSAEFLAAMNDLPGKYDYLSEIPAGGRLEGFLNPGIYEIPRQVTADQFLDILLAGFDSGLTPDLRSGFERQGLTLYEAVTLASVVQREAVVESEMPLIASVFLNRLAVGIPLEADSTVQYALGYNDRQATWWTNPLSSRDLQTDSPYNTYRNPGLPPAPIANPGADALRAVAFPAQTPYYYFRAACDGSGTHLFATTFEEHLQNACQP